MEGYGVWRSDGAPVRFPSARWELMLARALRRETAERTEFALPYAPARPWPLTELFCFARLERIGEMCYIIYAFDRKGAPIF